MQEEKRVLGGRIELFDHEKRRSTDDIAKLAAKFDELQRDNGKLEKDFARLSETARNLVSVHVGPRLLRFEADGSMCRWMQETQKEAGLIALREHEAKSLKMVGCLLAPVSRLVLRRTSFDCRARRLLKSSGGQCS
jgi:hypothetical protein